MNKLDKINILMEIANKSTDEELKNKAFLAAYTMICDAKIHRNTLCNEGVSKYEIDHDIVDRDKKEVYEEYVAFCKVNDLPVAEPKAFSFYIHALGYTSKQCRVRGSNERIYIFKEI